MRSFKLSYYIGGIILTVLAILVIAILMYPIAYVVIASLLRGQVIPSSFEDIERYGLSLEHYINAISDPSFIAATITSIIVALLNIIFSIFVIVPAAYAFSRFEFRGKGYILVLYLILSQIGGGFGVAAVIALFIFLVKLNSLGIPLIGNPFILPLIYTSSAVPFQTWLIKNYFDSLPRSLDEAAFIDGASWRDIVFRVIFPASRGVVFIVALFAFMGAWGEFLLASFIRVNTLAAYVYQTAVGQTIYWADFAARTVLFSIPIVLIYVIAQKYIGEAMRYGAGKIS
ncbi:MAG: ABC transporter permease subunit [Sulfolobales archaeon]